MNLSTAQTASAREVVTIDVFAQVMALPKRSAIRLCAGRDESDHDRYRIKSDDWCSSTTAKPYSGVSEAEMNPARKPGGQRMGEQINRSLDVRREELIGQAMQNGSVSDAIQTFNAVTALGILRPPQLVSTAQARFDATGNG
jgi:hypothetical protein